MFLHLGSDVVVNEKNIIGIFDLDNTSSSKITQEFLKNSTKFDEVINVSEQDLPKSFVVCEENKKRNIYISPIASRTLKKRSEISDMNYF